MQSTLVLLTILFSMSAPVNGFAVTIELDVLDDFITVGDAFDVDVWVDGEDNGGTLLAFGFDVVTPAELSYTGYVLDPNGADPDLYDVSDPFYPANVAAAGEFFQDDILLARLSFIAQRVGTGELAALGLFDGLFYGLMYQGFSFDIDAARSITVYEAPVPEPMILLLLASGLSGLAVYRRSLKSTRS